MQGNSRKPMNRPGRGSSGTPIRLRANFFCVNIKDFNAEFEQYHVSMKFSDGKIVDGKNMKEKIMKRLYEKRNSTTSFAYDGGEEVYTVGLLPQELAKVRVGFDLEERRMGLPRVIVELKHVSSIGISQVLDSLNDEANIFKVLNVILTHQAILRGSLLHKQAIFQPDSAYESLKKDCLRIYHGFSSSFRYRETGVLLNVDVSATVIISPVLVLDFIKSIQNYPRTIDWGEAEKTLRNLKVTKPNSKKEYKIKGVTRANCMNLFFPFNQKNGRTVYITVYNYFTNYLRLNVDSSALLPCLDVTKGKSLNYLPLGLCTLVGLQTYKNPLPSTERSLVDKILRKRGPPVVIKTIKKAVENYNGDIKLYEQCGLSIEKELLSLNGRLLLGPKLEVGNNDQCVSSNGTWDYISKHFKDPVKISSWAIVDFSTRVDLPSLSTRFTFAGTKKGLHLSVPLLIQEACSPRLSPDVRVEHMFAQINSHFKPGLPEFLLCILPNKQSELYGPWKKKNLCEMGIPTQCLSSKCTEDRFLPSVCLKVNCKLGGLNSILVDDYIPSSVKNNPTMILGMDVYHGSSYQSEMPSVAAVVGSTHWPSISKYRASVRNQSPNMEMIESLFKTLPNGEDGGMMRELLKCFKETSGCEPEQIIIFRDGVSDSRFDHVLNDELEQIIQALKVFQANIPKLTVVVVQKNHRARLFTYNGTANIRAGTVVDTKIVHPTHYDFYMCAHKNQDGTTRPVRYHVLLDEIGFSVDELQNLVHSLSYVSQRGTRAVSIVAPVSYADLAAYQIGQITSLASSSQPQLHPNISSSMFFC